MELEEGDVVLCTVDRIVGTIVFVHIEGNGEGSIVVSEIAPGRIRNLREYVVPKKKIVCKVLRISGKNIDLSLRRVTQKEKKEVLEKAKQEKSYESLIKSIIRSEAEGVIKKIKEQESLVSFLENAKTQSSPLEKLIGKKDASKILDALHMQKPKKTIIKKEFTLTSIEPNGLEKIKKMLGEIKDVEIKYISAGKYSIKKESENAKEADNQLKEILENLEKKSKKANFSFSVISKN